MTVTVLIVNWNGRPWLEGCLQALEAQTRPPEQVILVDNGSRDGSVPFVRDRFPWVEVIPLAANYGFAEGNNRGLVRARGDWVVTLNNDTVAAPDFLERLIEGAEGAGVEMAGATLLPMEGPERVLTAGIRVRRDGVADELGLGRPLADLPAEPIPVFGPSAGAAAYRRDLLLELEGFDPAYFAYLEDADLAWRARMRGARAVWVPRARVRHRVSATAGRASPFQRRLLARNRWRFLWVCWPAPLLRRHLPWILAYDLGALLYGAATLDLHLLRGRLEAWVSLRDWTPRRRQVQATLRVPLSVLERWLAPAVPPWRELLQRRRRRRLESGSA